eukprot:g59745.t1
MALEKIGRLCIYMHREPDVVYGMAITKAEPAPAVSFQKDEMRPCSADDANLNRLSRTRSTTLLELVT